MHALKVGDLRLVACFNQRLKRCLDEGCDPTAEHRLLTKEVRLRLFFEGGLQDPSTPGPYTDAVSQRRLHRVT